MKIILALILLLPAISLAADKKDPDPCKKERERWCKDIKFEEEDKMKICLKPHLQDLNTECKVWVSELRPKITRKKWRQQIAPENRAEETEEKK